MRREPVREYTWGAATGVNAGLLQGGRNLEAAGKGVLSGFAYVAIRLVLLPTIVVQAWFWSLLDRGWRSNPS